MAQLIAADHPCLCQKPRRSRTSAHVLVTYSPREETLNFGIATACSRHRQGGPCPPCMLFPSKGMPSLFSGQIRPIHGTFVASCSRCVASRSARPSDVLILGGTGRIGTAAAAHLIKRTTADDSYVPVVLLGGRSKERGDDAVREVESLAGCSTGRVKFVEVDYQDPHSLRSLLFSGRFGSVIHTAGPFGDDPVVLRQCIAAGVPTYVDVADPIPYIRAANQLCEDAKSAGTTAVICAGAFPGLSNVLGVECASRLSSPPKDLRFR